jgi:hypothetical protein
VSEKLYALYSLGERGEPVIHKYSSHVLGQYRSPLPGDSHAWIIEAWKREIRAALGAPVEPFPWEQYPVISPLTLTTWNVFKPYRENARLRPFDFLAVGILSADVLQFDLGAEVRQLALNKDDARLESCCDHPRPACALFSDPAAWREQDWRCLRCWQPWDFDARPRLASYATVIRSTLKSVERKRLCADGSRPTWLTMIGRSVPRPVRVESVTAIGKEVIVDPTDTAEELTAEMLNATRVASVAASPRTTSGNNAKAALIASPLVATPRKQRQPRPYASKAWSTPRPEPLLLTPSTCAICGEPVHKRRRRHCDACMPKARREHGLRAIEAARKVLAAQSAAGNDPRRSAAVNRTRSEAISEGHRRNRRWAREHPGQRDEAWFKREIAPKLDAFTLAEIAAVTGLSFAACSRIRARAKVPHPRHWEALRELAES